MDSTKTPSPADQAVISTAQNEEKNSNSSLGKLEVHNSPFSTYGANYGIIYNQGGLYMAGNNDACQIGDGTHGNPIRNPVLITFPYKSRKIISVSCGCLFTGAVAASGETYMWGSYDKMLKSVDEKHIEMVWRFGPLVKRPALVDYLKDKKAIKIVCSASKYGVIMRDGSLYLKFGKYAFGACIYEHEKMIYSDTKTIDIALTNNLFELNNEGELHAAYLTKEGISKFCHLKNPEKMKQTVSGFGRIVLLTIDGHVYSGRVRYSDEPDFLERRELFPDSLDNIPLPPISFIASGGETGAAVGIDGKLFMWGDTNRGQIADRDSILTLPNIINKQYVLTVPYPVQVSVEPKVKYVATSVYYTLTITESGDFNYRGYQGTAPNDDYTV